MVLGMQEASQSKEYDRPGLLRQHPLLVQNSVQTPTMSDFVTLSVPIAPDDARKRRWMLLMLGEGDVMAVQRARDKQTLLTLARRSQISVSTFSTGTHWIIVRTRRAKPERRTRPSMERVAWIGLRLGHGKAMTATAIAKEFEVCTKTIHRDLEFMRDRLHVPLEWDAKHNTWKLVNNVRITRA